MCGLFRKTIFVMFFLIKKKLFFLKFFFKEMLLDFFCKTKNSIKCPSRASNHKGPQKIRVSIKKKFSNLKTELIQEFRM